MHIFTCIYTIYSHTHQLSPSGVAHVFRTESLELDNQSWDSSLEKTSLPSLSTHELPVALHWSEDPTHVTFPVHTSMSTSVAAVPVLYGDVMDAASLQTLLAGGLPAPSAMFPEPSSGVGVAL